jgi:hypothetical protein
MRNDKSLFSPMGIFRSYIYRGKSPLGSAFMGAQREYSATDPEHFAYTTDCNQSFTESEKLGNPLIFQKRKSVFF